MYTVLIVLSAQVHLAHVIPEAKETLTVGMAGALSSTLGGSGRAGTESAQEQGERRVRLGIAFGRA